MARGSQSTAPVESLDAEAALEAFIGKFDAERRVLIAEIRDAMRKRFPAANELVWDNYNFFVIGYSPTERPSDAPLSIAASAKGVSLCFIHGASLLDPTGVLTGAGKQTRFLRLTGARDLDRPEVESLLTAAVADVSDVMRQGAPGRLVIRSISAKQRPRRKPAK